MQCQQEFRGSKSGQGLTKLPATLAIRFGSLLYFHRIIDDKIHKLIKALRTVRTLMKHLRPAERTRIFPSIRMPSCSNSQI